MSRALENCLLKELITFLLMAGASAAKLKAVNYQDDA